MKIYNYHAETKEFLWESDADPSPLEPGVYLIPAHATNIKPPKIPKGKLAIFNNENWSLIENKRGVYYSKINGEEIINDNPFNQPENATTEVPPEVVEGKILKWNDEWILEDIPVDSFTTQETTNFQNLTPEEKLNSLGLTIEDLKTLLGL